MNVLIVGLNYAPEPVGIGPYTAGMARFLAAAGHDVSVVCAKPYYPRWKVDPAYAGGGVKTSMEHGVRVTRLPLYVPETPSGAKRLAHHASFTARAMPAVAAEVRRTRPDVVMAIAPSLISTVAARRAAKQAGARLWLHIQDFEVEAAFATGLLKQDSAVGRQALRFETYAFDADRISTISPQMCAKLVARGIPAAKVVEFRNWANLDSIRPLEGRSPLAAELGVDRPHVALYSGNIANKQGIEIVVAAARRLIDRRDLMFVMCGNGPNRVQLEEQATGLDNIHFTDLQPMERLSDLLGMASVHLLPQIADATDLVLPSKLTNMLASGRPVVATAHPGTGLAQEVEGCGIVTSPEDADALADAITVLLDNPKHSAQLGRAARARAEERWSRDAILGKFESQLLAFATA